MEPRLSLPRPRRTLAAPMAFEKVGGVGHKDALHCRQVLRLEKMCLVFFEATRLPLVGRAFFGFAKGHQQDHESSRKKRGKKARPDSLKLIPEAKIPMSSPKNSQVIGGSSRLRKIPGR